MENTLQKLLRESKNFAQSASNSVASNVSAPVDGLAWLLKKAGIPGIRYLDGGSRATGGTSNYVVFPGNEGLLSIMERNGQKLP